MDSPVNPDTSRALKIAIRKCGGEKSPLLARSRAVAAPGLLNFCCRHSAENAIPMVRRTVRQRAWSEAPAEFLSRLLTDIPVNMSVTGQIPTCNCPVHQAGPFAAGRINGLPQHRARSAGTGTSPPETAGTSVPRSLFALRWAARFPAAKMPAESTEHHNSTTPGQRPTGRSRENANSRPLQLPPGSSASH